MILLWLLLALAWPAAAQNVTFTIQTNPARVDVFQLKPDAFKILPNGERIPDPLQWLCTSDEVHTMPAPTHGRLRVQFGYTAHGWWPKPSPDPGQEYVLELGHLEERYDAKLDGPTRVLHFVIEQYFWVEVGGAVLLAAALAWFKVGMPLWAARARARSRAQRLLELKAAFDPADPWLGRRFGAYRLVSRLGAGGMAAVYRALDDETLAEREPVAVKVMHTQATLEAEDRFRREARVCAQLNHPNLVRILDAGDQDGVLYLAMELIEGKTLRSQRNLAATRVLEIFRFIFAGVEAAHSLGIVHRDLKPDNVMLSQSGRVVVMDFGLARRSDLATITATGAVLGTPAYMAPEQIRGEAVDPRLDQYALGVMLYEMLAGRLPFDEDLEPMQLLMQHLTVAPRPLETGWPGLDAAVMRMLEKSPADRFSTLAAAWQALSEGVPQEDPGAVSG